MGKNLIIGFKDSDFPKLTGNGLRSEAKRKDRLDIRTRTIYTPLNINTDLSGRQQGSPSLLSSSLKH